jgi:ribosomal protein L11 methyltransferase
MKSCFEVCFTLPDGSEEIQEILMAFLSDLGYESFREEENRLWAYCPEDIFDAEKLKLMLLRLPQEKKLEYSVLNIPYKNWNEEWEKGFQPVVIKNECVIKARHHHIQEPFRYEILIEPKMAFGTGHHETTALMIEQMLETDFKGKSVLDMGCGTAVLAILASKMGAEGIIGVDNDQLAIDNAFENISINGADEIQIMLGDSGTLAGATFDVILANINRNIILEDLHQYASLSRQHSILILSGFFMEDLVVVGKEAAACGFVQQSLKECNGWVSVKFEKS